MICKECLKKKADPKSGLCKDCAAYKDTEDKEISLDDDDDDDISFDSDDGDDD